MDIRLLTLLLFLCVASSFAELRSPFFRVRRSGLEEIGRPRVMDIVGSPRIRRETDSSEATESPTATESTADPDTVSPRNKKKPDSTSETTPATKPVTSSTTKPTPKSVPKSKPSVPKTRSAFSTTPEPDSTTSDDSTESTTPEADPETTDESTTSSPTTKPAPKPAPKPRVRPSRPSSKPSTPKPVPKPSSPSDKPTPKPSKPSDEPSTPKPSNPSAKSPTPKPAPKPSSPTTEPSESTEPTTTPDKPSISEKPSDSESPGLRSRFDPSENKPVESSQQPIPEPNAGPGSNPVNPGFPNFMFPQFFMPFSPYNPYNPYSSYGDPNINSIPNPGNFGWAGTNAGANAGATGAAASFASASASAGTPYDATYNNPTIPDYRGGVPENVANTAKVPDMVNPGVYGGYGAGAPFDSSFIFPGADNIQRQIQENFNRLQSQIQQQQQAIFEASNRIGTEGFPGASGPGVHSSFSSINLGPEGGYQTGGINPVAPGVQSRFAEDIPPPSGGSYGVFSSSSSQTAVGPDGKTVSHKVSTTGVNDNGKITFRTVHD